MCPHEATTEESLQQAQYLPFLSYFISVDLQRIPPSPPPGI